MKNKSKNFRTYVQLFCIISLVSFNYSCHQYAILNKKVNYKTFENDLEEIKNTVPNIEFDKFKKTVMQFNDKFGGVFEVLFGYIPIDKNYGELYDAIEKYNQKYEKFRFSGECNGDIEIHYITEAGTIKGKINIDSIVELSCNGIKKRISIWN